uniref:Uncharacterized protein n=1 Tax=Alexandrium catenella TaxID=2925 RepID=A0A7S1L5Q3_ALECA|mmetsp:Transcript_107042/g.284825  ORF Transcript_107042/g.284825 Transcript_107042/m.284825 type:complete len:159 (+) Transcript_107042:3-479(+)
MTSAAPGKRPAAGEAAERPAKQRRSEKKLLRLRAAVQESEEGLQERSKGGLPCAREELRALRARDRLLQAEQGARAREMAREDARVLAEKAERERAAQVESRRRAKAEKQEQKRAASAAARAKQATGKQASASSGSSSSDSDAPLVPPASAEPQAAAG